MNDIAGNLDIPNDLVHDLTTLVRHYINTSPWASWSHLCIRLMNNMGEETLVKDVKEEYIARGMFRNALITMHIEIIY